MMPTTGRVTITLPVDLVEAIDRLEKNRSRFIAQAVEHELARRRREGLLRSLRSPHPEAAELAEAGLAEWGASLPADDEGLVDPAAGRSVRWIEGEGWVEETA
jgi:predicted transcriptional regulator